MTDIHYKEATGYIDGLGDNAFAPVFLIYGEEYLYKSVFEAILNKMVPKEKRSLGYEPVDGDAERISGVIERLNTFSLMPGRKVVAISDSKIFFSKNDEAAILTKAKDAFDEDDKRKAAGYLRSLLSVKNLDFSNVLTEKGKKAVKFTETFGSDDAWLKSLSDYCTDNGIKIPPSTDNAKVLSDAIEKGFPDDHHLIITAELIDKRKGLFKTIQANGVIIDCSVPKGDRKADKDQQAAVLRENTSRLLTKAGKQIAPDAYRYLLEMTGFDLRTFTDNLERLISYTGQRSNITVQDAAALTRRTKQDPIYELSGAIAERNLEKSLFYAGSLLDNAVFPLQILATLVNQIRRLLIARDFIETVSNGKWRRGMDYNGFRNQIMPLIKDYDAATKQHIEQREMSLMLEEKSGKKSKKKKTTTDVILAKNPNSPYPVFLLLQNAEKYSTDSLINALDHLKNADRRLKSTGEDARLVIDDTLIKICK